MPNLNNLSRKHLKINQCVESYNKPLSRYGKIKPLYSNWRFSYAIRLLLMNGFKSTTIQVHVLPLYYESKRFKCMYNSRLLCDIRKKKCTLIEKARSGFMSKAIIE